MVSAVAREKYLLTLGIVRMVDKRYVKLPRPGRILQLLVTNLRNRPLSQSHTISMCTSILGLYHGLVTGSRDFPVIPVDGYFRRFPIYTPFGETAKRENTPPPSPPPAPPAPRPRILTPVLPERSSPAALQADPRNSVHRMTFRGVTFTRVISTVYQSEDVELTNRWRVTDYGADGRILMSVLCQFLKKSAVCAAVPVNQGKRKAAEEEEFSPKKRMRL